jgi:hypothetical protein
VRDIRSISLIDALDFGMYQPHSGKVKFVRKTLVLTMAGRLS